MDEYARFAALYDPVIGPFLRPIHKGMLSALSAHHCHKVVDLCCGTGLMAGMASDAGLTPVGVDVSPAMLSVARQKHPHATFIDGDASNLFFSDNEFDAATISFALHEKPMDVARAILAEAVRVIRPGGLILVADYRLPTSRQSRLAGWAISTVERIAGKEHYDHFSRYMNNGGTETFLAQSGLPGQPVKTFMSGWVGLFINAFQ